MFGFSKHTSRQLPKEVITSLDDLMRFEWLVQSRRLLPDHPVYSLLAGRHASKLRGRGLDFEEVRLYAPGDDIRNIDWRVTARTGQTHSKVFNEEKERPSFIILDQSTKMFFGSQRFVKSVSAAHAAAISAFYTLKRGDRFGGIIFNEDGYDYVPSRRNKESLQYYLQCVVNRNQALPARTTMKSSSGLLNRMLQQAAASITHDYVISIISDFSEIDTETKERLQNLSQHNDVILVHIYDALEEALPDGKLVLGNGRRQIRWNNQTKHWGAEYQKSFSDIRHRLTDEFRQTRIPIVFFNTTEPVEDQIMHSVNALIKK